MKLDPERKAEWVRALRSGEYTQGSGALAKLDGEARVKYCCLGVAADLAVKAGRIPEPTETPYNGALKFKEEPVFLPPDVATWLGISTFNPSITYAIALEVAPEVLSKLHYEPSYTLSLLNDTGATFEQIADMIERDL